MAHLTQDEIALWATVFNDIDRDGDGHINVAECVEFLRFKHRSVNKDEWLDKQNWKKFEHILAHAPVDAEAKFPFTEFKQWIHHHGSGVNDNSGSESEFSESSTSSSDEEGETMNQLFNALDSDCNGYITLDEMLDLEKEQAEDQGQVFDEPRRREELMHFMRLGDLDRDHRLNLQEFVMAMRKRAQDGSAFYSDSDTDIEISRTQRLKRRQSQRKKMEKRKSKRMLGMMKMAGKNKNELKTYAKTKDDRIDLKDYDVCARLRQVFDTLDNDGDDCIDVEEFLLLEPHLKNVEDRGAIDMADRKNTLRRLHKQFADEDGQLPFNEFMKALHALRLTNEQLKNTWDSVLWAKEREKANVHDIDMHEIQTGLTTLRESVLRTEDEDETVGASSPTRIATDPQLKKTKDQLRLALQLADTLREKYERSQAEVGNLTTQLLKYKRGNNLPPPPSVVDDDSNSNGSAKGNTRSHAERNQEFFYLCALAVKLNIEKKYRADHKSVPHMCT